MTKRVREDENECRPRFNGTLNADLAHLIFGYITHPLDIACCRLVCKDWNTFFSGRVKQPMAENAWFCQNRWEQLILLCNMRVGDTRLRTALYDDSAAGVKYYLKHTVQMGDLLMQVFDALLEGGFALNVTRSILLPTMLSQPNDFMWRALYFASDIETIQFLINELPSSRLWTAIVFPKAGEVVRRKKLLKNMRVANVPQDCVRKFMPVLLKKHDMISTTILYCFAQYTTVWPEGFCAKMSKSAYEPHQLLHWKLSERRCFCN